MIFCKIYIIDFCKIRFAEKGVKITSHLIETYMFIEYANPKFSPEYLSDVFKEIMEKAKIYLENVNSQ